jgi:hypothetical protein
MQFASSYALAVENADASKLSTLFFDEARRHLVREEGKPSITTVQALFILYMYCIGAAKDRLGLIYRFTGCEMYKLMKSGMGMTEYRPNDVRQFHRKLLARHAWGVFYFETLAFSEL